MKVGAAKSDRIYEDITDMKKLHNVLSEVVTAPLAECICDVCGCSIWMISICLLLKK